MSHMPPLLEKKCLQQHGNCNDMHVKAFLKAYRGRDRDNTLNSMITIVST